MASSVADEHSSDWMKGPYLGSGSFGSVYLVMDTENGLLKAVKKIKTSNISETNEELKRTVLNALIQEISHLKDFKHENLVQYLGN